MYCKHSKDEPKKCSAVQLRRLNKGSEKRVQVCDIYDEPIKKLKKCPLQ